ncbi:MAG: cystathionine gamma-synthase [Maricaulaceae bacterium]|jgi:cystathionine gamma-synthase
MTKPRKPDTLVAAHGVAEDPWRGAVAPPIHLSTTYAWRDVAEKPQFDYSRTANPTRATLAGLLAELEGGAHGIVTATGMAAVDVILNLLSPGDLLVAPHDCYGGSHRLFSAKAKKGNFEVAFVDQTDLNAVDAALARKPKLVWIETPSNPLLRVTDIREVATRARTVGALVCADNTFLSPARQQPLVLGCDLVMHSTTKFINGHTDVVGGAIISKDAELGEELAWWTNCVGASGSAFDSFLTLRGARTLFARLDRQEATAGAIAETLDADERVAAVHYPGLPSHPGHEIAAKQQSGFGALLSFELADGFDARAFMNALELVTPAASLGGFETLACLPASMTHAGMDPKARLEAGVTDSLIRLSAGLENAEDLLADIDAALKTAKT